jgi:hypothetical protein
VTLPPHTKARDILAQSFRNDGSEYRTSKCEPDSLTGSQTVTPARMLCQQQLSLTSKFDSATVDPAVMKSRSRFPAEGWSLPD